MSIIRKLASDTAIYGIPSIVGRFINFILIFFFAAYFTPALLAPQVEFYAYAAFFFVVLPHGMETAFFNFSRDKESYKDVFATAISSVGILALIFTFIMAISRQDIADFVGYSNHVSYVIWFILILAIDTFKSIPYALLRYLGKSKKFAWIKSVGILVNVGLNIFFVVFYPEISGVSRSIEYVFIANLIASFVEFILLFSDTWLHFGKPNFSLWKRMISYSWPLIVLGFAGMINETFDRISMNKLLPEATAKYEIGVYGTFYRLSMVMTIFIQAFRYAAEPLFFDQADKKDAKQSYVSIMNWFVFACGFIFLVTALFKSEIAHVLIKKPEYFNHPDALIIVPILLLANLFLGIFFNLSIWYKINNKTLLGALISLFGAIITVVLLLVYVPEYGFKAAAYTTLISYFLMSVVSYFVGQYYYPVSYNIGRISVLLITAIGMYLASEYLMKGMGQTVLLNLIFIAVYISIGIWMNLRVRK
ncbi:polysaccharide biosynthesis C-terminal domain-containing protein [Bacteroidia bacterium]|nr:polysaccharide biosynthesis C-terminal domain-containing protein [Bacteroidia bacterium]MDC3406736.1 polysaccharide biosynthesis C-terminal domain-containing protein [Bacteroidia bacterium]